MDAIAVDLWQVRSEVRSPLGVTCGENEPVPNLSAPNLSVSVFLPALAGGGAERAMLHLAQGFAQRGIKTDLVLAQAEGPYLSTVPPSVQIVNLQSKFPVVVSKTLGLVQYLQRERPTILLSALDIVSSATWACRLAKVPTKVVMCVQTHLTRQFNDKDWWTNRLRPYVVRQFYPWADKIIAASAGVAEDVAQMSGLPRSEIPVIFNPVVMPELLTRAQEPVDHPWFASGAPPVIIGVGRLVNQKDFATLIRAFAWVRHQYQCRLMILGEGEKRAELEALITELGLEEQVALPGFAENPYAYMARAKVFALSSVYEGFGNVVAEALAVGTPVVSTDCESGPAEILANGEYGRLVPVGDAHALGRGILATLRNPLPESVLKQRSQAFSLDPVVDQYLEVLSQIAPMPMVARVG